MSSIWTLVVVLGPILLAAALIVGVVRNRRTSAGTKARTESATRDLYAREDRTAHRDGAVDDTPVDGR